MSSPLLGTTEDHYNNNIKGANEDTEVYDEAWLFGPEWALKCFLHVS